ncbi:MAG: transposase, partial [Planctomycetota bacterium]
MDRHLDEFLEFFFPEVRVDLDLRRGYRPLDKELEQLAAKSRSGLRLADKVVEVYLRDGSPIALIIHIEVQGHVDRTFEKRMFTYNYRLFDRFDREVVSLAVLTDANPEFRPQRLRFERWGYLLRFEFPSVKLLDWNDRTEELKASRNPFALVTLAHLDLQTC